MNTMRPYLVPPTAVARVDDREVRGAQLAKYPADAALNDIDGRAAPTKRTTAAEVDPPLYFMSQVCRARFRSSGVPAPAPVATLQHTEAPTCQKKAAGLLRG